jgi:hypothetical protein
MMRNLAKPVCCTITDRCIGVQTTGDGLCDECPLLLQKPRYPLLNSHQHTYLRRFPVQKVDDGVLLRQRWKGNFLVFARLNIRQVNVSIVVEPDNTQPLPDSRTKGHVGRPPFREWSTGLLRFSHGISPQMITLHGRFAFELDLSHGLLLGLGFQDKWAILARFW